MKKNKIIFFALVILVILTITGCTTQKRDWKKDAREQGYYQGSDGKWYHR